MATPAFRAVTAKSAATTGTNAPGLPAGLVAGDIVLLVATVNTGATISISTTGSVTWNVLGTSPFDVAAGEKLYVWWGRYVSGATGPTLSAASDADHSLAFTIAYSGCIDVGSPIDSTGIASSSETTSDTSFSFATGVSATAHNVICVCIATSGVDSNTGQVPVMTNASLASINSRANYETTSGGGGGCGLTDGTLAAGGSMGTFACTYGGASPKAYVAFALRGGSSGVSAVGLTDTITTSGVRKTLGVSAVGLTDTITTSGALRVVGISAMALTDTVTTSGTRKTFGSTATVLTDSVTTSGTRKVSASSAAGLSFGVSTSAKQGFFAASATVLNAAITTAGTRIVLASSATNLADQIASAGGVTKYGASTSTLTFTPAASGFNSTTGSSAGVLTVGFNSSASRTTFAAAALPLGADMASAGTRQTFASTTTALSVGIASAGIREVFAAAAAAASFSIFTAAGGKFGSAHLALTAGVQTDGARSVTAAASLDTRLTVATRGSRQAFGASTVTLIPVLTSVGRVARYGTASLPVLVAFDTRAGSVIIGGPVTVGKIAAPTQPKVEQEDDGGLVAVREGRIA